MSESDKKASEMTVEEALKKLDTILADMDREDQTLEDSFQSYREGLELIHYCTSRIEAIEQKLQVLENEFGNSHE